MALRVLVVEDDAVNRRFIGEWLIGQGHECLLTSSLAEATTAVQQRRIDLCLADLRLPDGDGRDLQPLLAEHVPLLLMSGDRPEPDGAWLQKPLTITVLTAALQGICAKASLDDPLPAAQLPDLDDLAAGAALGAGLSVLGGLRDLLRVELERDGDWITPARIADEPLAVRERLHQLKASSALCGLPRLHSATHHLYAALIANLDWPESFAAWQLAVSRAIKVVAQNRS